jgi:NAD-dependent dihydropyrimidine dehydrogenase PreA subunit
MERRIVIDGEKCKMSGVCIKACPQKAIYVKEGKVVIDDDKCDLDGICIAACPNGAINFSNDS